MSTADIALASVGGLLVAVICVLGIREGLKRKSSSASGSDSGGGEVPEGCGDADAGDFGGDGGCDGGGDGGGD